MQKAKPKILITGASGMLGEALCRLASEKWSVTGVYHRHPLPLPGVEPVQADLTDPVRANLLLADLKPEAVIHAAAQAQTAACEQDPQAAWAINVQVPAHLARQCAERKVPFIFTSSDLVFDGRRAPYAEDHPVNPVCVYGRQKAQAEKAVADSYARALVCRLPLMFGVSSRLSNHFCHHMLMALRQGRPLSLFADELRTPVDIQSASRGILSVLGRARGVLHMGGRTRVSRYELGLLMARYMEAAPSLLRPVPLESSASGTVRSPDCSLNSQKAYSLGYDPMPLAEAVKQVVQQFKAIHPNAAQRN